MNETMLEPAAFLDLWQDKLFLGQEFLSWLWITSEINGNLLNLKGKDCPPAVELWFESRLTLEAGEGNDRKSVTCQAPGAEWAEAHTALKRGKKMVKGRLKIRNEEKEWGLTLAADTLTPQSVKLPRTFAAGEEEDDTEAGRFLERAALLKELLAIVESLFRQFLEVRLSPEWERAELPRLNRWLADQK
ncbi:MAG: hypothetical protein LBP55_04785 [Candidatus Adiutrix sp.]|jgi:recombination associated protein RdgC|nr:hypothetical protein [Candidatus Adiutrix sp.]